MNTIENNKIITEENNKLIAEFMGVKETRDTKIMYPIYEGDSSYIKNLEYHKNWSWLMEVVEKIESLEFVVTICYLLTKITNEDLGQRETPLTSKVIIISCNNGGTKIQTVYNACIEFIKWYNEQKK